MVLAPKASLADLHRWRVITAGPSLAPDPAGLELRVAQAHPFAPGVSPHKPLFQQVPYLPSREYLQQLKLLSALSQRLTAIIKAVFSSPLLFLLNRWEAGHGAVPANRNPGNPWAAIWCVLFLRLVSVSSLPGACTELVKTSR